MPKDEIIRTADCVPTAFFERDPCAVARDLIGCLFLSNVDGVTTGGMIVETEAYLGAEDPGSHAATRGITPRNAVMYGPPGCLYVYFTYGNHYMVNIVCEPEGTAGAVLLRALEPLFGLDEMGRRRSGRSGRDLANGPGKLACALGLDIADNGKPLGGSRATVLDGGWVEPKRIARSGRIGLSAGHEMDLRYYLAGSPFVSKGRTGPVPRKRRSRNGGTTCQ